MIGFNDVDLSIEKASDIDLRGVAKYDAPKLVKGFITEKTSFNYQTGESLKYMFITLPEPSMVKKEDKINGYRVESVKDVWLHGQFIVSEVTAR